MKIKQINYNWRQVGPLQSDDGHEFDVYAVGSNGVEQITNITPEGYSGPEFYDVLFSDGRINTVYNVNECFTEASKGGKQ